MAKTTLELEGIISLGGGISLDASTKTTMDLKSIARLASNSGAFILLRNSGGKTMAELKEIAKLAPGKVIFEF